MSYFPLTFVSIARRHAFGKFECTVVDIPGSMEEELPLEKYPRLRVEAAVKDEELNCALQSDDGHWVMTLPRKLLRATGVSEGDEVIVRMRVADQSAVDVPEELLSGLARDAKASSAWGRLTPGKKRSFAWRVRSAKRPETRTRRVAEVLGELNGSRRPKKQRGRFG